MLQLPDKRYLLDHSNWLQDGKWDSTKKTKFRVWRGSAFGGVKGRSQLPDLVADYMRGDLKVDEFITHRNTLRDINGAFSQMKQGDCIRAVVDMKK